MKEKGFAPILIIILITLVAIGGYLVYQKQFKTPSQKTQLTPTPSSTSESTSSADITNWKIYVDQKNGFLFKYPNNWYPQENQRNTNYYEEGKLPPEAEKSVSFFKVGEKQDPSFMAHKGNEQLVVNIIIDQSFDDLEKTLKLNTPQIMIEGNKVLKYATGAYISLKASGTRVLALYSPIYPNEYLDQILSTFKFLDQKQSNINLPQKEITGICDADVKYKTQLQVQDDLSAQKSFQTYVDYMKVNKLKDANLAVNWVFKSAEYAGYYKDVSYWTITFSYSLESGEEGNNQVYVNQNGEIVELRECI